MTPILETSRLRLRAPRLDDASWMTAGLGNQAVARNLLVPVPYTNEMADKWLTRDWDKVDPEAMRFSIDLKGNGGIGGCGFNVKDGDTVLSYWLAEPYWGRGIMTEALRALVGWYYETSSADNIVAGVFHFNMASLAVQYKLGFAETGRSMVHSLVLGQDIEHIDTELTRDTFEALTT